LTPFVGYLGDFGKKNPELLKKVKIIGENGGFTVIAVTYLK
jgi:hypothetical protein